MSIFGPLFCVLQITTYSLRIGLGFVGNQPQNRGLGRRKSSVVAGLEGMIFPDCLWTEFGLNLNKSKIIIINKINGIKRNDKDYRILLMNKI